MLVCNGASARARSRIDGRAVLPRNVSRGRSIELEPDGRGFARFNEQTSGYRKLPKTTEWRLVGQTVLIMALAPAARACAQHPGPKHWRLRRIWNKTAPACAISVERAVGGCDPVEFLLANLSSRSSSGRAPRRRRPVPFMIRCGYLRMHSAVSALPCTFSGSPDAYLVPLEERIKCRAFDVSANVQQPSRSTMIRLLLLQHVPFGAPPRTAAAGACRLFPRIDQGPFAIVIVQAPLRPAASSGRLFRAGAGVALPAQCRPSF